MTNQTFNNFRNPGFDHFFIGVIPILAILSAYYAVYFPEYFPIILGIDLFFLGYHHVISTYTRLALSSLSLKEHRFIVFVLPFIILSFVVLCVQVESSWLITTIYIHWQWWHYTRQSEGVMKSIRMKTKSKEAGNDNLNRALFYLIPIATFLVMSSRQHTTFLFNTVYTLAIPEIAAKAFLLFAIVAWCFWFIMQLKAVRNQQMSKQHLMYLFSHHIIYFISYVMIEDITLGWLAINIWHNLQYITFVWHFNSSKFKDGVDRQHLVLSWLSQVKIQRIIFYFSSCLLATFIFYGAVDLGIATLSSYSVLPLAVIAYQTINFHHYIVDSRIWKMRKPIIRKTLGIDS